MAPKELLGVLVRLVGLGSFLFALFDLYYLIAKTIGLPTRSNLPVSMDVQGIMLYFILGFGIIVGAKWIVRLAYWQKD